MRHDYVTGGSGKAGRACIAELLAHNYEVASIDLVRPPDALAPLSRVELTDFGQTIEAFSQIDDRIRNVTALVHLAAIPAPGLATNSVTFATNTISTYNVFEAARQPGIKNVVWASSETVLGLPFDTPPPYVPLDEEYPGRPESAFRCPNWSCKFFKNNHLKVSIEHLCSGGDLNPISGFCFPLFSMVFPREFPSGWKTTESSGKKRSER